MKDKFNFVGLFIYDMANNHQGNLEHGLKIIKEIAKVSNEANVRGALKFQFRQLDTFIHPDYRTNTDNKHIPRFLSTRLSREEYGILTEEVKKTNLLTICTPFDEESVDLINEMRIEIIKIGSPSATDWPLLEKIAGARKPVICSTGGLSIKAIDSVVSFFEERGVDFALMHCVVIYPTPNEKLELNQIEALRSRYPHITIGFSTHEEPDNFEPIRIAYAKGARIFERHVGLETKEIKLNLYSSTPEQIKRWLQAYKEAVLICGAENRPPADHQEKESLQSLMRGVFAKEELEKGVPIKRANVLFAMPLLDGQLRSGEWNNNFIADKDYKKDEPLPKKLLGQRKITKEEIIYQIMLQVKGMLNNARIVIGDSSFVELSHHYGIERFREFGAVIINCINRTYCKKLIIQLPRQKHPYHYHRKKEETFQVLYGELEIEKEGSRKKLCPGDIFLIKQGEWHKFQTLNGVIFEEISTTHYEDDSFYEDEHIDDMPREERKTKLNNWGGLIRLKNNL